MKPVAPVTSTVAFVSGEIMMPSRSCAGTARRRRAGTRTGMPAAAGGGSSSRARRRCGAPPSRAPTAPCWSGWRGRNRPSARRTDRRGSPAAADPGVVARPESETWPCAGVSVTVESVLVPTSSVPRSPRMTQLLRRSRVRLISTRPVTPFAISRCITASASTPPAASSQYSKLATSPNHHSSRSRTWRAGVGHHAAAFRAEHRGRLHRPAEDEAFADVEGADRAEHPGVDDVLGVAQRRREAAEQADGEARTGTLGRLDHRVALGGR